MRGLRIASAAGLLLGALSHSAAAQTATVGLNFTAGTNTGWIPPDTMGTVGSNHIVETLNGRYAVYDKSTGAVLTSSSLDSFWIGAGVSPTTYSFDPRVTYDPYSQRYYAAATDNPNGNNNFLFAVSNTSNPLNGWTGFKIDADSDNGRWADFPMLGYSRDYVTLSANMFDIPGGSALGTAFTAMVIPKNDVIAASPTVANRRMFEDVQGATSYTAQGVVDLDNDGRAPSFWSGGANYAWRSNIGGSISSPTLNFGAIVAVPSRAIAPDGNQPGAKANLDSADLRYGGSVVLQNGTYWGAQNVNAPNNHAGVRWFQIDADTNTLLQEGVIYDSNNDSDGLLDLMYPSIAVNENGDVVIGFSGTSEQRFASAYAIVGKTTGGVTSFGDYILLKAGLDDYVGLDGGGRNRWGDYSSTVVDPSDPFHFWTFQEFVISDNVWAIQVSELIIPEPGILSMVLLPAVLLMRHRRA